jgi:hypothetical protein
VRRAGLAALAALFVATVASASDGPFVWRTVCLLGGNSREHMYLVSRHGSDGALTDSVFVYERSNNDPHWTQRTLIRATIRRWPSQADTVKDIEAFIANFDLGGYMVDHGCHPPFFLDWPAPVGIDAKGMYCGSGASRSYFMTRAEMMTWLDYDLANLDPGAADLRAVDLYRTTAKEDEGALTDFIIVRAGTGGSDGGEYEAIVPVEDAKLRAAAHVLSGKTPRTAPK